MPGETPANRSNHEDETMNTPPSKNLAPGACRKRSEVGVSVELVPGGCKLFRLQWPERKPD